MDLFDRSAFSQRLVHDKMPFARWCDQKLKEFLLRHRIEIFRVAQTVATGFQAADGFLERLFIGFANAHHFPDRAHLGTEFILYAFELFKRPASEFDHDIIAVWYVFVECAVLAARNIF